MSRRAPSPVIRVLHVIHQLGDGGADRALTRLANASDPDRYRHTILALGDGPGHEPLRPVVTLVLAPPERVLTQIGSVLGDEHFDVVHGWVSRASIVAATIAAAGGMPLVLRNPTNMALELQYEPQLSETYWPELQRAFQAADAVVVPSPALVPSTRRVCGVAMPVVIPNAVDVDGMTSRLTARHADRPFVLAHVGRLSPQKDPLTVVEAMGLLASRQDWRLRMFGHGNLRRACEARASELGIADRLTFCGFDREWTRAAGELDAYVSATRYEGMSNSLLEAAALGLPIVTTSIPENQAVVAHGRHALMVPPGNPPALAAAVMDLMDRDDRGASLGRRARRRMQAFSPAAMVTAHEQLYARLARAGALDQVA